MKIPNIGLGFWQIKKEDVDKVVKAGLESGYLHIDTAIAYQNEKEIGDALEKYNVEREKIFITSKIPAEIKTYEGAKKAINDSLNALKCKYLDLMLIHAPKPWALMMLPTPRFHKGNLEVWKALEEAKKEGKIKEIGVSNFNINDLKNIMNNSSTPIFANQIRVHIGHTNKKTIDFCNKNNILVEAYSPCGTGRLFKNKQIKSIAEKYNVSISQLCIQYDLQLNTIPLARSKNPIHIKENIDFNFKIDVEDMKKLDKIFVF